MAGSDQSGDDIEAGVLNFAESTTKILGSLSSEPGVGFDGISVFEAAPRGGLQSPAGPLNGILGVGGNGWLHAEPAGAGVVGIGAPNRGPGMVGLGGGANIGSSFLGSQGNLGSVGLGGTGLVGVGGPGDISSEGRAAALSLPGAGVVGQGGGSLFKTPAASSGGPGVGNGAGVVGIAGGRGRPPDFTLSQADLAATANVGVFGFGGDGPKTLGTPPHEGLMGPVSAGAGVRGVGGVAGGLGGPGVVGIAGNVAATGIPADSTFGNMGVGGFSLDGVGVHGKSGSAAGVSGGSSNGVGVAGDSGSGNGGYFSSAEVAQIHLEPHKDPLANPNGMVEGRTGDLLVLTIPLPPDVKEAVATLWFCRIKGNSGWVQLA
jgi:hypothetical protein